MRLEKRASIKNIVIDGDTTTITFDTGHKWVDRTSTFVLNGKMIDKFGLKQTFPVAYLTETGIHRYGLRFVIEPVQNREDSDMDFFCFETGSMKRFGWSDYTLDMDDNWIQLVLTTERGPEPRPGDHDVEFGITEEEFQSLKTNQWKYFAIREIDIIRFR